MVELHAIIVLAFKLPDNGVHCTGKTSTERYVCKIPSSSPLPDVVMNLHFITGTGCFISIRLRFQCYRHTKETICQAENALQLHQWERNSMGIVWSRMEQPNEGRTRDTMNAVPLHLFAASWILCNFMWWWFFLHASTT